METRITFGQERSSIYPGEYQPPANQGPDLMRELQTPRNVMEPPVSVRRFSDYYKIEVFAPGFTRQDFMIQASGRKIGITANNTLNVAKNQDEIQHRFHLHCIKRDVILPNDVDTEFVTAEYKDGILSIFLFKNLKPVTNHPGQIIVY